MYNFYELYISAVFQAVTSFNGRKTTV